jgi:peptidoglycan/LPS O-acetylase OafA/YrhL
MTVAFFLLSLLWTPDTWKHVYVFVYQPVRIPLYVGYFVFGMVADRQGWFAPGGYQPRIAHWLPLCLTSAALYAIHQVAQSAAGATTLWRQAVTAVLFNAFCLSALMAGLSIFRRFVNGHGRVWRSLARNSYGIYYVHPLILYPLAYLLVSFSFWITLKAAALIGLTVAASWGFSELVLTRAPGLRRAFGPGMTKKPAKVVESTPPT